MDDRRAISLDDLDPAPWNPKTPIYGVYRRGLETSLDHFGLRDDLKVWPNPEQPGRYFVLDGNQRLDLLREKGTVTVECRVLADLDDEDAKLFTAAFDRNHSVFDEGKLSALLSGLKGTAEELKKRLCRPDGAILPTAPAIRPEAAAAAELQPTVPILFVLTREGYDDVKETALKTKARLKREERLRAALHGLDDREIDDLVVELALRIADA
jgi:ParB-like chromosome segregation protein Spo0J